MDPASGEFVGRGDGGGETAAEDGVCRALVLWRPVDGLLFVPEG